MNYKTEFGAGTGRQRVTTDHKDALLSEKSTRQYDRVPSKCRPMEERMCDKCNRIKSTTQFNGTKKVCNGCLRK